MILQIPQKYHAVDVHTHINLMPGCHYTQLQKTNARETAAGCQEVFRVAQGRRLTAFDRVHENRTIQLLAQLEYRIKYRIINAVLMI